MIYLKLFYEFLIIGLFTIGGGLATIPYLKSLAIRTNWFEVSFITDMIAISESTPGPIGLNIATYVGYEVVGLFGGIIATVAEMIPSIIIVLIVSKFLESFKNNLNINFAFYGLRPTVTAFIAAACFEVLFNAVINVHLIPVQGLLFSIDFIKIILFAAIFYLIMKFKKHPIVYIAVSGLVGIILKLN